VASLSTALSDRTDIGRCVETIDVQKFRRLVGFPPGAYPSSW